MSKGEVLVLALAQLLDNDPVLPFGRNIKFLSRYLYGFLFVGSLNRAETFGAMPEDIDTHVAYAPMTRRKWCRAVMAMEPGEWYGRIDIAYLAGAGRNTRGGVVNGTLEARGFVQRARNKDYAGPTGYATGSIEPQYLFALTADGERLRAWLHSLNGPGSHGGSLGND
jgi:hypothetical protein